MTRKLHALVFAAATGATALAAPLHAQARTSRASQTIEIRGQVPTPQVVTVRPRRVPAYSRALLPASERDHSFWPAILGGVRLVPQRAIAPAPALDTAPVPMPLAGVPPAAAAPASQHAAQVTPRAAAAAGAQPTTHGDSLARAIEIETLKRQLDYRRARIDSLEHVIEGIDATEAHAKRAMPGDTLPTDSIPPTVPDSTPRRHP